MKMKEERNKRGLTTIQVAEKLGVSVRTVESWESGLRNPSKQVQMLVTDGKLDK
jgi:transcriptional regulator with XRE-family HTH domain